MIKLVLCFIILFSSYSWACAPAWHISTLIQAKSCAPVLSEAAIALNTYKTKPEQVAGAGVRFAVLVKLVQDNDLKINAIKSIFAERQFILSLQSRLINLKEKNIFDIENIEKTFRRERLNWTAEQMQVYRDFKTWLEMEKQAEVELGPSYAYVHDAIEYITDPTAEKMQTLRENYRLQKGRVSYFVSAIAWSSEINNPPLLALFPGNFGEKFWVKDKANFNASCDIDKLVNILESSNKALEAIRRWRTDDTKLNSLLRILYELEQSESHTLFVFEPEYMNFLSRLRKVIPPSLMQVFSELQSLVELNLFWGRLPHIYTPYVPSRTKITFDYNDPMNSINSELADLIRYRQKVYDQLYTSLSSATSQLKFEIDRLKKVNGHGERAACMKSYERWNE